jgi:hypothetical protein
MKHNKVLSDAEGPYNTLLFPFQSGILCFGPPHSQWSLQRPVLVYRSFRKRQNDLAHTLEEQLFQFGARSYVA